MKQSLRSRLKISGEGQCRLCDTRVNLTRHHLIPKSWYRKHPSTGGRNHPLNLVPLCLYCHAAIDGYLPSSELGRHLVLHRQLLKRMELRHKLTGDEVEFMTAVLGAEWVDQHYPLSVNTHS